MSLFETDLPLHLFHHGENFKTYELMGAHPATYQKSGGTLFAFGRRTPSKFPSLANSTIGMMIRT